MKAVICTGYGPPEVLQIREVAKPVPKEGEVLIKIFATTAHVGDVRIRSLNIPGPAWQRLIGRLIIGVTRPKWPILGMDIAGEIEARGKEVQRLKPGDQVFASCGLSFGAYAEYRCLPEEGSTKKGFVALKPSNMSYEEAAPIPNGGLTALCVLQQTGIQPGQKVLIYGASGSVGTFSVQIAKHFGAEVTGVCSTSNLDMVRSIGADHVIDYTSEDFTKGTASYDVILDAVSKLSDEQRERAETMTKTYVDVDPASDDCDLSIEDLHTLKELCEAGELRAVIDRTYPLDDIVEAHRYVEGGHKRGNVVVTVRENGASADTKRDSSRDLKQ